MQNKAIAVADLQFEINQKFKSASRLAKESREAARAAVVEAVECGQMLARAKRLIGFGKWMKWCADNLEFSYSTAENWIAIGEDKDVLKNLDSFATLKDVYIAVGIMPKSTKGPERLTGATVDIYEEIFAKLNSRAKSIHTLLEDAPIEQWPSAKLSAAKQAIEPLVRALWPEALPTPTPG